MAMVNGYIKSYYCCYGYIYGFSWCFCRCYCSTIPRTELKILFLFGYGFVYGYLFEHAYGYCYGYRFITFRSWIKSVPWLESRSTGKYQHSVSGIPSGCALGNSLNLMLVFPCTPLLSSRYRHNTDCVWCCPGTGECDLEEGWAMMSRSSQHCTVHTVYNTVHCT